MQGIPKKKKSIAGALTALLFAGVEALQAQTTTLRYGQIPSTMKSVSALHFNIAQRKGLFAREGINATWLRSTAVQQT